MNFNAHKRIISSAAVFAAVFAILSAAELCGTEKVSADSSVKAVKASAESAVNAKAGAVYALTKTDDTQEVQSDEAETDERVRFSAETIKCSESGSDDGGIKIIIENGSETDEYFCSFNGGKTFRKMNKRTAVMEGLSEGCYSICIMKNADKSTMSEMHTVYLSSEDEIIPVEISADSVSEQIYSDGMIKIHISGYDKEKSYEASVDGGRTWKTVKGRTAYFYGLTGGEYTAAVREADAPSEDSQELQITLGGFTHGTNKYIKTECILQNPELPTGCEITSLTMLLNYMGYDVDKLTMADDYLPKGEYRNSDFYEVFVGDPRNYSAYGCFSKPIAQAAESFLKDTGELDRWDVRNITGCTADSLYAAIDRGYPVVVWASMEMKPIGNGRSWTITETGKTVTWPSNEHCLLLVGYNTKKKLVYMNDPLKGTVAYKMSEFEKMFDTLGNHAVIIVEA
ncbi:MAG: C39 family peptidase [Oscillospiraceae bacterium]|nr:C39 family peptidase [Oscillospiraceae bacterium]